MSMENINKLCPSTNFNDCEKCIDNDYIYPESFLLDLVRKIQDQTLCIAHYHELLDKEGWDIISIAREIIYLHDYMVNLGDWSPIHELVSKKIKDLANKW